MDKLQTNWYKELLEDLRKLEFTGIVLTKWNQGKRILRDFEKFGKPEYGSKRIESIAKDLKWCVSNVYYAVQFAKKYPKLSTAVENYSWDHIRTHLLPKPRRIVEKSTIALPEGKFNVIYADPPWRYEFSETNTREIENHYPTMELEEIKSLKIPSAEDSVLFLWATAPKLEEAMQVMNSWGFKYRTCAVWDKEVIGMGYWFRGQHELLLLGIKGEFPTPPENCRHSSVIKEKRGKHSEKPKKVYEIIEKMFPNGKYLELFARNQRKGWTSWGNEI